MKRIIFTLIVLFNSGLISLAQDNMGIGILTPDASAVLELYADDKGFLTPRVTAAQRDAIVSPADGLLIYNTDDKTFWYFDGAQSAWVQLAGGPGGQPGPTGPAGPAGVAGPTGPAGNDGAQGPAGATGAAGNDGAQGPVGPTGAAGGSGGLAGPTGPTGAAGNDGAQGPAGPTGAAGNDGAQGPAGATGANGNDGAQGPAGPTGAAGNDGAQGPAGPTGAAGNNGAQGPAGPTGAQGTQGPAGPVGCSTPNMIIKSNGSAAVCSQVFDNGTNVSIGSTTPFAVDKFSTYATGTNDAISGYGADGRGVYAESVTFNGVESHAPAFVGVWAESANNIGLEGTGNVYGVLGDLWSNAALAAVYGEQGAYAAPWAVWANGDFGATGLKAFIIDHPLDPQNKTLTHYCTESNEPLLFYRGNIVLDANGEAVVELPDYVAAVNTEYTYQLTPMGKTTQVYIAEEFADDKFKIAGGTPGVKISWQLTGRRNDPYAQMQLKNKPVEALKTGVFAGKYLTPHVYGAQPDKGFSYEFSNRSKHSNSPMFKIGPVQK